MIYLLPRGSSSCHVLVLTLPLRACSDTCCQTLPPALPSLWLSRYDRLETLACTHRLPDCTNSCSTNLQTPPTCFTHPPGTVLQYPYSDVLMYKTQTLFVDRGAAHPRRCSESRDDLHGISISITTVEPTYIGYYRCGRY